MKESQEKMKFIEDENLELIKHTVNDAKKLHTISDVGKETGVFPVASCAICDSKRNHSES